MRFCILCVASLLIIFGSLAGSTPQATAQQQGAKTMVFILFAGDHPKATMEPLLLIEQGHYKEPVETLDSEAKSQFLANYYREGRKYRMLFGGGDAGTVTVSKPDQAECARMGAEVVMQTQARLNRNVMALATDSDSLGHKKGSRRAPTDRERAAAMSLARNAYQQKGVPASLLPGMRTINLTATDLNGDGKAELIGTFVVKRTRGSQRRYVLFLLAEPQGNSYRAGLAQYTQLTQKDVQGGLSLDDIVEGGIDIDRLVDPIDLDNDGMAEVITISNSYEGVGYTFYKKQKGQWQNVFESGGYRCAF